MHLTTGIMTQCVSLWLYFVQVITLIYNSECKDLSVKGIHLGEPIALPSNDIACHWSHPSFPNNLIKHGTFIASAKRVHMGNWRCLDEQEHIVTSFFLTILEPTKLEVIADEVGQEGEIPVICQAHGGVPLNVTFTARVISCPNQDGEISRPLPPLTGIQPKGLSKKLTKFAIKRTHVNEGCSTVKIQCLVEQFFSGEVVYHFMEYREISHPWLTHPKHAKPTLRSSTRSHISPKIEMTVSNELPQGVISCHAQGGSPANFTFGATLINCPNSAEEDSTTLSSLISRNATSKQHMHRTQMEHFSLNSSLVNVGCNGFLVHCVVKQYLGGHLIDEQTISKYVKTSEIKLTNQTKTQPNITLIIDHEIWVSGTEKTGTCISKGFYNSAIMELRAQKKCLRNRLILSKMSSNSSSDAYQEHHLKFRYLVDSNDQGCHLICQGHFISENFSSLVLNTSIQIPEVYIKPKIITELVESRVNESQHWRATITGWPIPTKSISPVFRNSTCKGLRNCNQTVHEKTRTIEAQKMIVVDIYFPLANDSYLLRASNSFGATNSTIIVSTSITMSTPNSITLNSSAIGVEPLTAEAMTGWLPWQIGLLVGAIAVFMVIMLILMVLLYYRYRKDDIYSEVKEDLRSIDQIGYSPRPKNKSYHSDSNKDPFDAMSLLRSQTQKPIRDPNDTLPPVPQGDSTTFETVH